jgi:DNA-binding HxlR family transcriptional regulator
VPDAQESAEPAVAMTARKIDVGSVARALNLVGDRWNQLLIQEALRGASGFEELRLRSGASRNTLSNRLRGLVASGVLEQRPGNVGGARRAYFLTPMGADLFSWILLVWGWSLRWDADRSNGPSTLTHVDCGKAMLPVMVCAHCGAKASLTNCTHRPGPGAGRAVPTPQSLHRRRYAPKQPDSSTLSPIDVTADRWTGMVVATQYFGLHRFDEMQQGLGIASNILADRLRTLVANGIFERRLYQVSPARHEYGMTTKGKDLYPHALALMHWADRWLAPRKPSVIVEHLPCGHVLTPGIVCSECHGALSRANVAESRPGTHRRR